RSAAPGPVKPPGMRRGPRPSRVGGLVVVVSEWSLAAGQLLAQRLQRLVRGERAARGLLLGGRSGRVVARRAGLEVGLLGLGDLLLVGLPAGVRLGVLALPLGTGLLVALLPLAGLRVEALRVDVVAVLVVGRGHAVQRRVEVLDLDGDGRLVGLLERQRDAATLQID